MQGGRTPAERIRWVPWGEPREPRPTRRSARRSGRGGGATVAGRDPRPRAGAGARPPGPRRSSRPRPHRGGVAPATSRPHRRGWSARAPARRWGAITRGRGRGHRTCGGGTARRAPGGSRGKWWSTTWSPAWSRWSRATRSSPRSTTDHHNHRPPGRLAVAGVARRRATRGSTDGLFAAQRRLCVGIAGARRSRATPRRASGSAEHPAHERGVVGLGAEAGEHDREALEDGRRGRRRVRRARARRADRRSRVRARAGTSRCGPS